MNGLVIEWLQNDTYQVVEYNDGVRWTTWYQGSISDCEAYVETWYHGSISDCENFSESREDPMDDYNYVGHPAHY